MGSVPSSCTETGVATQQHDAMDHLMKKHYWKVIIQSYCISDRQLVSKRASSFPAAN